MIRRAREEGCDAAIGGYSVNLYAKQEGMPSVVIRTGEDTIRQAPVSYTHLGTEFDRGR